MECGVRAGFCILRRYIRRYQLNTVRLIISRWAPSNENHTQSYINSVSSRMGIDPDTEILYEDEETMIKLVDAMIRVECGEPIKTEIIYRGYEMA